MSLTRIIHKLCGFPLAFCICGKDKKMTEKVERMGDKELDKLAYDEAFYSVYQEAKRARARELELEEKCETLSKWNTDTHVLFNKKIKELEKQITELKEKLVCKDKESIANLELAGEWQSKFIKLKEQNERLKGDYDKGYADGFKEASEL